MEKSTDIRNECLFPELKNSENYILFRLLRKKWLLSLLLIVSTCLAVIVYNFRGHIYYPQFWPIFLALLFVTALALRTIRQVYEKINDMTFDICAYIKEQSDLDEVDHLFERMYANWLNIVCGLLFAAFVTFELYYLGFLPPDYLGVFSGIIVFVCLHVNLHGYYQLCIFIYIVRYICSLDQVNYNLSEPSSTKVLQKIASLMLFYTQRFIILGAGFSGIYLLGNLTVNAPIAVSSNIYYISWAVVFIFIVCAIPILVFYPRKLITERIKQLKNSSMEKAQNNVSGKLSDSHDDTTMYFQASSISMYEPSFSCESIAASPDFPITWNNYMLTFIIHLITVIIYFLTYPDNLKKMATLLSRFVR